MGNRVKYTLSAIGLAVVIAAVVILPSRIAIYQDSHILNKVKSEEMDVSAITQQDSMIERLKFIHEYDAGTTTVIPLQTGNQYTQDTIRGQCMQELAALEQVDLISSETVNLDENNNAVAVELHINNLDVSKSAVLWTIYFKNDKAVGAMIIDDETGKILSFNMRSGDELLIKESEESIKQKIDFYAQYLKLSVVGISDFVTDPEAREKFIKDNNYFYTALLGDGINTTKYTFHSRTDRIIFGDTEMYLSYGLTQLKKVLSD